MRFYYENETLFIEVTELLNVLNSKQFKRRVFRIVDDYDIDHIVIRNYQKDFLHEKILKEIAFEYQKRFSGKIFIK